MEYNGMEYNGMEYNGMEYNDMASGSWDALVEHGSPGISDTGAG